MIGIQKIQKIWKMLNPDKNPDPEFWKKKFFLKFFFFNCEQFLLNTFLSKMIINPKKVSFLPKKACFLHFSCTPHSSTDRRTDVVKFGYKIYKMAYSLTLRKSAHCFFREKTGSGKSGKNPDMKFLNFRVRF